MKAIVSPEQRQAAEREIVRQMERGASAQEAKLHSLAPIHRATVYRLLKRVQSEGEVAFTDGRHGRPVKLRGRVLAFLIEQYQVSPCTQYISMMGIFSPDSKGKISRCELVNLPCLTHKTSH